MADDTRNPDARAFLAALTGTPDAAVTFQTFDDDKARRLPALARILHGTLGRYAPLLGKLSADGAGVFVMVNEGDGRGRGAANVTGLRALFVDDDKGTLDPAALALPPSVVVRSKAGCHVYWKLRPGEPLAAFEGAQRALAARLGTDATMVDLPRVLRVPGFDHRKDPAHPFPVRLVSADPSRAYTVEEVRRAFDLDRVETKPPEPPRPPTQAATGGGVREAIDRYNRERSGRWPASGSGACPVCGDAGSFGRIPESDPPRWSCFSTDHGGVGRQKGAVWYGDQLDLDADAAGLDRLDLLRREGYLAERPRPTDQRPRQDQAEVRQVAAPAPVVDPKPDELHALRLSHRLPEVLDRMENAPARMATGWPKLDQALGGGFRVPSFAILAARPKAAKSLWAQVVAEHRVRQGGVVYYLDLENGEDRFFARLLCRSSRVGHDDLLRALRAGETDRRWPDADAPRRYSEAQADLAQDVPFYYDERRLDSTALECQLAALRKLHPEEPVLFVVDSLQKLPMRDLDQRRAAIDGWLRDLERWRTEYRPLVILAISELRRGTDGYEARPSNLKESGDLEYTADLVLLLDRPDPEEGEPDPAATLWVAYNRDGAEGVRVADYTLERPFYGLWETDPAPPRPPPSKGEKGKKGKGGNGGGDFT